MKKEDLNNFKLTELFLVKVDWGRTYFGEVKRSRNENGKSHLFGSADIDGHRIFASAETEDKLAEKLDILCILTLDYNI